MMKRFLKFVILLRRLLEVVDKKRLILWVEAYFYRPNFLQKCISFLLLPLSFLYCLWVIGKRVFAKPVCYGIPIVSIGNRTVGGSGKTPFIQTLVKEYEKPAIILRGYKRESKGLYVVSLFGEVQTTLEMSGDEAMLYALTCKNALVIVSENRPLAIKKAKELGAKLIFLDDGFSKSDIKKFDILLTPKQTFQNHYCLPSGPFRESKFAQKFAKLVLQEGKDFKRIVSTYKATSKMVFVTAIANASRLDKFLPKNILSKEIFPDHHAFTKEELEQIIKKTGASSLLVTRKDWVKIKDFDLPLSLLELNLEIDSYVKKSIDEFIQKK